MLAYHNHNPIGNNNSPLLIGMDKLAQLDSIFYGLSLNHPTQLKT